MFTKKALGHMAAVAVLFGSFFVVNSIFSGIGVLLAFAVLAVLILGPGWPFIKILFDWAAKLAQPIT